MPNGFTGLQMPIANREAAESAAAAEALRVQSQMGRMPAGRAMISGPQAVQTVAAEQAAKRGQIQNAAAVAVLLVSSVKKIMIREIMSTTTTMGQVLTDVN